jgi:hypothetical protein
MLSWRDVGACLKHVWVSGGFNKRYRLAFGWMLARPEEYGGGDTGEALYLCACKQACNAPSNGEVARKARRGRPFFSRLAAYCLSQPPPGSTTDDCTNQLGPLSLDCRLQSRVAPQDTANFIFFWTEYGTLNSVPIRAVLLLFSRLESADSF